MAPTVKTISRTKMKDNKMKTITNKCGNIITIDGIKAVLFHGFAYTVITEGLSIDKSHSRADGDGYFYELRMISIETDHFLNNFFCPPGGGDWSEKWNKVYDMTQYSPEGGKYWLTAKDKVMWFRFKEDLIHVFGDDAVRSALKAVKLS